MQRDHTKIYEKLRPYLANKRALLAIKLKLNINPQRVSHKNMMDLYARLRDCRDLPPEYQARIQQEKNGEAFAISDREREILTTLLHATLYGNHATFHADSIQANGNEILSTRAIREKNLNVRSHSDSEYGEQFFAFMSVGYKSEVNIVQFLDGGDVFVLDLDKFSMKYPKRFACMWNSGHLHAHFQEQSTAPIIVRLNNQENIVKFNYKTEAGIGIKLQRLTRVKGQHGLITQTRRFEEDVVAGRQLKLFYILRLIEFVRMLDEEIRDHILNNGKDIALLASVFDILHGPGKAELLTPVSVPVEDSKLDRRSQLTPQNSVIQDQLVKAVSNNQIDFIRRAIRAGYPVDKYRYTLEYYQMSLLNIAVRQRKYDIVRLLIESGADANHCYVNHDQHYVHAATRTSLQDAVELQDYNLIRLLFECTNARDNFVIMNVAKISRCVLFTAIAEHVNDEILLYLLNRNIDISNDELICIAAIYGNVTAIQWLINAGVSKRPRIKNYYSDDFVHILQPGLDNRSALGLATQFGQIEALQLLLAHGFTAKKDLFVVAIDAYLHPHDRKYKSGKYTCKSDCFIDISDDKFLSIIKTLRGAGMEFNPEVHYRKEALIEKTAAASEEFKRFALSLPEYIKPADVIKDPKPDILSLVTARNQRNELMVLLGRRKFNDLVLRPWCVPTASFHSKFDSDWHDCAVKHVSYQTGLNLSGNKPNFTVLLKADQRPGSVVAHYHLSGCASDYEHMSSTNNLVYRVERLRKHKSINQYAQIQFISLAKLKFKEIYINNIALPVYCYQDKPLEVLISYQLALLEGRSKYNRKETLDLVTEIVHSKSKLVMDAIQKNKLEVLKSLMSLGSDDVWDDPSCQHYLTESLKTSNSHITCYLLDLGFNLIINGIHNDFYNKDNYFDINIIERLIRNMPELLECFRFTELFKCMVRQNIPPQTVLNKITNDRSEIIISAVGIVIEYGTVEYLKKVFEVLTNEDHLSLAEMLKNMNRYYGFREYNTLEDYLYIIKYLMQELGDKACTKHLCRSVTSAFSNYYREESNRDDIIDLYISIMTILLQKKKYCSETITLLLHVFYKLRKTTYSNLINKTLSLVPAMDIVIKVDNGLDIDSVLFLIEKYRDDESMLWLLHFGSISHLPGRKHIEIVSLFMRAIELSLTNVVSLLVKVSFKACNLNKPEGLRAAIDAATHAGNKHVIQLLTAYMELPVQPIQKDQNVSGFLTLSTESPLKEDNLAATGDVDSAIKLCATMTSSLPNVKVKYVNQQTSQQVAITSEPQIFHLFINAPRTGFGVSLQDLAEMKARGVKIVMTVIEFLKHRNNSYKQQTLDYLAFADQVIFLDEPDKNNALLFGGARSLQTVISASVIPIPASINSNLITANKSASNIIFFGMIRTGKGLAHVLHLAELIKASESKYVKNMLVYIVGSVQKHKTRNEGSEYDASLYKILKTLYPAYKNEFFNKTPEELIQLCKLIPLIPDLPVKLLIDAPANELAYIFGQCRYAFYPAYRGATLRNSSLSTMLAYGCVTYSHVTDITPSFLCKGGQYAQAMVLASNANYHTYASSVLNDIIKREKDDRKCTASSSLNAATLRVSKALLSNTISDTKVYSEHEKIYRNLLGRSSFCLFVGSSRDSVDSGDTAETGHSLSCNK